MWRSWYGPRLAIPAASDSAENEPERVWIGTTHGGEEVPRGERRDASAGCGGACVSPRCSRPSHRDPRQVTTAVTGRLAGPGGLLLSSTDRLQEPASRSAAALRRRSEGRDHDEVDIAGDAAALVLDGDAVALTENVADADRPPHTPPSMTAVGQGTVRRMTQFPVPLLRTNVKPARSKRVRVPL